MKDIKILVACHKPAELPDNELFLPIQVGAKNAAQQLPFQQDDDGENISDKNPTYCELTAQYWAWKNLQADYCGLCHYRRYLCMHKVAAERNYRNQIEASVMNPYNIHRFGLDNATEMRQLIEQYDVVIGEDQQVNRLYTPRGTQSTAYKHWAAHDRALIMQRDLDTMLDILSEVSPEVGAAAREYLAGKTFLGFNCFVMKKPLFDQLCAVEFETLSRLEQKVDLSHYCQQLTRIYGFMGEIISSSFVYYLQKTGQYKIKQVPILYFNYTEPLENFAPLHQPDDQHVPLIFDYADSDPLRIGPVWQTFLDHISPSVQYDTLVISDLTEAAENSLRDMTKPFPNVKLRFVPALPIRALIADKYGLKDSERVVLKRKKQAENDNWYTSILPFLPYIFPKYDKALVIDRNTIFCDDIAKMWQASWQSSATIVAPRNAFVLARLNDIYYETAAHHLNRTLKDPYQYFSTNAFIWDFATYRQSVDERHISKLYPLADAPNHTRPKEEILNILCEGQVEFADIRWSTWFETSAALKYQLPYAPCQVYQELLRARKSPGMITYLAHDPWEREFSILTDLYWAAARRTPFYELVLQHGADLDRHRAQIHSNEVLTKAFPVDSKSRAILTKILPYNSKRNRAVKKVLGTLHLR